MIEFKNLEGVSLIELTDAFNLAFSDYFIKFEYSPEQFHAKMQTENIMPKYSIGAFSKNKLISFILHGYDEINGEKCLYNGGTGVIPEFRGQNLTQKMYQSHLPILKEKGINKIQLEVIRENTPALKSYLSVNFKKVRELPCFAGGIILNSKTNENVHVRNLHEIEEKVLQSFWDVEPTWQNSFSSIERKVYDTIRLGAFYDEKLIGYIFYCPKAKRIHQIAVDKNFRRQAVATKLMNVIAKEYATNVSISNVDMNSNSTIQFLEEIGLKETFRQIECELRI